MIAAYNRVTLVGMPEYPTSTAIAPYARALQQSGLAYPIAAPYAPPRPASVWDSYRAVLAPTPEPLTQVQSAVQAVRFNLESAFIGGLLGLIHGKLGTLDIKGKYPADGILAAFLLALSVQQTGKGDGISADLRAMGQSCTTIAFFRKASQWAATPATSESTPKSVMSGHTDPLLKAAEKLGFKEGT